MVELDPEQLLVSLRDAARALTIEDLGRDRDATLTDLVPAAVTTIAHAQGGRISRTEDGTVASGHATSDDIGALDQLPSQLGQGPCITAADDPASRGTIGQAKGILMERFTVTDQHAFRMLVRASQDTNVKLFDVARWLTHEAGHAARPPTDTAPDPGPTAEAHRAHVPNSTGPGKDRS